MKIDAKNATIGPWFAKWNIEPGSGRSFRIGYVSVRNSSDMQGLKLADLWGYGEEERIANACLMSASPELFAFAVMAIRACYYKRPLTTEERDAGLAAIEKASHYEAVRRVLSLRRDGK